MSQPVFHLIINELPHKNKLTQFTHGENAISDEIFKTYFQNTITGLGQNYQIHYTTLENWQELLKRKVNKETDYIICVADGTDKDGAPGPKVFEYLQKEGYRFTGGNHSFQLFNEDKIASKTTFLENGILTPKWMFLPQQNELPSKEEIKLKFPMIVKLTNVYSSVGLDDRSVVNNYEELKTQVQRVRQEFSQIYDSEIIIEEYIIGDELTSMVYQNGDDLICLPVLKKSFKEKDPLKQFLTFDNNYKCKFDYELINDPEAERASVEAFKALGGEAFAKVDLRRETSSGNSYVLEVNAVPGLGPDSTAELFFKLLQFPLIDFLKIMSENVQKKYQ